MIVTFDDNGVIAIHDAYHIKDKLKLIPGRRYNPETKAWEFPVSMRVVTNLKKFGVVVPDAVVNAVIAWQYQMEQAQQIKHMDPPPDLIFKPKTEPYRHQRVGVAYLLKLPKAALIWDMGLGKTKTIIDISVTRKKLGQISKVLIICPNTLKSEWEKEVRKHSDEHVIVLRGSTKEKKKLLKWNATFYVVNVESVYLLEKELQECKFDFIVIDEATRIKNQNAKRTATVMKLNAPYKAILTGTPVVNTPLDLWAPFTWLDRSLFGSYWAFRDRYVRFGGYEKKQVIGYKNLDELHKKLEMRALIYRKEEVLDLPPKVYHDRWVEMDKVQRQHYEEMKRVLRTELFKDGKNIYAEASTALVKILRLAQITGGVIGQEGNYAWLPREHNAKLQELEELLKELGGEKTIIWCRFVYEIKQLMDELAPYNPVAIYGDVSLDQRAEAIRVFQEEEGNRIFIGQPKTAGFGVTLTAAKNAIYWSRDFSLEDYLQSQDRIHRIGQTGTVNIIHLLCEKSIDEQIHAALKHKKNVASLVVDGTFEKILEEG